MDLRAKNRSYDNVARYSVLELYDSENSSGFIFQLLSMKYHVSVAKEILDFALWGKKAEM